MVNKTSLARIARVATVPFFVLTLLRTQIEAIRDCGASVTVITSPDELMDSFSPIANCEFKPVYIAREISLFSDLVSLVKLVRLFRLERYDIVHSNTPKAGLLSAIAAKFAGAPIRLHTFTGQTWVTMHGIKKSILKGCDKLIGLLNTHCYADSPSQREFLIEHKIVRPEKITVLGSGSLSGVNLKRFNQANFSIADKNTIKASLALDDKQLVLLFVGRITKEKGVFELINSFSYLMKRHRETILLMVGPFEQGIEQEIKAYAKENCDDKVVFLGICAEPEKYIAIADLLCLPSYREGFGTVVIEAAAMGVPAVASKIYGLSDAVIDGETGLLVEPKNTEQLTAALERLILDKELRAKMGKNAKSRAYAEFDSEKFGELMVNEYEKLLQNIQAAESS